VLAGLKTLELTFDPHTQILKGKNASVVLRKALDQVLLKGFKLPELSLYSFELLCGENMKNEDLEGIGVTGIIIIIIIIII